MLGRKVCFWRQCKFLEYRTVPAAEIKRATKRSNNRTRVTINEKVPSKKSKKEDIAQAF